MNISRLTLVVVLILVAVIVLVGFLYLQSEITGLRNAGHPSQPTATPTATTNPAATPSPNYVVSSTEGSTTATNDGTTLVCNWTFGNNNPYAVIFLDNGSNSVLDFNAITITNVGNVTAYVSEIRFQTYSSNGTVLLDHTIPATLPVDEFLPNPNPSETVLPGDSFGVGFSARDLQRNPGINNFGSDPFSTLIISPVWSNTPPNS